MSERNQEQFMRQLVESQAELAAFVRGLLPFYPNDVEDVVQNTNYALIAHAKDFDPSRPFHPWMFSFARRQVLKFCGTRAHEPFVFDDALAEAAAGVYNDMFPGDEPNSTEALLKQLAHCKDRLSPQHRELLDKRYQSRKSVQEIAHEQHESTHNVVTRLAYIRKLLHDCITRFCHRSDSEEKLAKPTADESLVNDVVENLPSASKGAPRLSAMFHQNRELLQYWLVESCVDSLLLMEASRRPAAVSREGGIRPAATVVSSFRFPKLVAAASLAAGLTFLLGGVVWFSSGRGERHGEALPSGAEAVSAKTRRPQGRQPVTEVSRHERAHESKVVQVPRETVPSPIPVSAALKPVVAIPAKPPVSVAAVPKTSVKTVAAVRPAVSVHPVTSSAAALAAGIKKEKEVMKLKTAAVSVAAVAAAFATDVPADDATSVFTSDATCVLDTRPYAEVLAKARNGYLDTRLYGYYESGAIAFDTKTPTGTIYSFH